MTLTPDLAALGDEKFVSLTTFRKSGEAVDTTVWIGRDGDTLVVTTPSGSGKVKRLRNDARARIAPCNVSGKLRGPWRDARARVVAEPDRVSAAYAALRAKYGWQMRLVDFGSWLTGRIGKRAIIEIDPLGKSAA